MVIHPYRFSETINKELDTLSKSDNWHTLLNLVGDLGIIAFFIFLTSQFLYFYPLTIFIIGARQRALATLMHDAAHKRAASYLPLNHFIGCFTAHLIFQSFDAYRHSHIHKHHRYLGDPQQDPDFLFYQQIGLYHLHSQKESFLQYVMSTLFLLNMPRYIYYLFKNRFGSLYQHKKEGLSILLIWTGIISSCIYFEWLSILFLYWFIPYFTAFMLISHFIEVAEHYPLLGSSENTLFLTRNRFSHRLEAFFCSIHNENYHLVHHLRASIPYWNMKKAHKVMLQDEGYRKVNKTYGGIFISSNHAPALIAGLLSGAIALPNIKLKDC